MTDELETLRQQVTDCERGGALAQFNECNGGEITDPMERLRFFCSLAMRGQDWLDVEPFFSALKHGQGEPIGYFCDVNSLTPEQGKRIEQVVESAKDDPDVFPLFATPQTCFSAGDMADAQAKAFWEGAGSNRAAIAELVGVLNRYVEHFGDPLQCARAAIAKHTPTTPTKEAPDA